MKIVGIDTYLVNIGHRDLCFVKVRTDEGLYGVGEAYSAGPDEATANVIHYFEEWLLGMDPFDIEGIWQKLYIGSRFPGGSVVYSALSGIDHALWDIKGRALNTPVYQLLGGKCRQRIRVYQNPGGATPEETLENAQRLIERYGFTAIKTNPLPPNDHAMPWPQVLKAVEHKMALLREGLGDEVEIGLDPHARILEPSKAIDLCQVVAPFRPMFVEEPLRPENVDAMAEVRAKSPVPIATGEMLYTKWEFRDLLKVRGADIIQPDICCCGGITEMKKIAALAEAEYVTVAPHNPMGPVATAVNAQFAATAPTFLILEYHVDTESPRKDLVEEPYRLVDGYLELPDKPGLGIELNEEYYKQHPYKPWKRAMPLKPDGSMAFI
ncbi:MAG TPA: galactonate dehydratase [Chloroflexi bacterium]|jgi:galactonate dehydratase|nr:galactonate dehydratase [Chloroflexota bacterium]